MKESRLIEILDGRIQEFHSNIDRELEDAHHRLFDDFGFPIFAETSKDFHEQVYFQSYLEHYTRALINGTLKDLIEATLPDAIYRWPEMEFNGWYIGFTNAECEQKFSFEFFNEDEGIGYLYRIIPQEEVNRLFETTTADYIRVVTWEQGDEPCGIGYVDERIDVINVEGLFHEVFSSLLPDEVNTMYARFLEKISEAVRIAADKISLVTLPGFTPIYRNKTRDRTLSEFKEEVRSLECLHVKSDQYKYKEENSKQLIQIYNLPSYFLSKGYVKAFVGTSDYAKSFLTSEYLFHFFERNPLFDYTPIVSGYIKSVEQLLHKTCFIYRNANNIRVSFKSYTLADYIAFLSRNPGIIRPEVRAALDIIIDCLDSYRIESRNHLFHKDYLSSWEDVTAIRSNTIFIYTVLLGSVDTVLIEKNPNLLCLLRDRYEKLFRILDGTGDCRTFTIAFEGREYSNMQKKIRLEGIVYDNYGLISNPVTFSGYSYGEDIKETVVISKDNMPKAIWIEEMFGEKKKIW